MNTGARSLLRHHLVVWPVLAAAMCAGLVGATSASGSVAVRAAAGDVTVVAGPFHQGPGGTLTTTLRLSTSGESSDVLDAALAAGGGAASVYHRRVSVGEITDLAGCGGGRPPAAVVDRWLHYGPLTIPGGASGDRTPATATLTVHPDGATPPRGSTVPVTLYFAHSGSTRIDVPVE